MLVVILGVVAQDLAVEISAAIITDFFDVIPDVACAKVHPAAIGCMLVLALCLLEHHQEVKVAYVRLS